MSFQISSTNVQDHDGDYGIIFEILMRKEKTKKWMQVKVGEKAL